MNGADTHSARRFTGRFVTGLILLALGVVFLLDNFDIIDAGRLWDWWPVLLIAVGLSHLLSRDTGRRGWGMVILAVGTFFLLRNFHLVTWRWRDIWPFVLVLIGANLVWRSLRRRSDGANKVEVSGDLNEFAVLGGGARTIRSQDFRGGEVSAVMGGFEVDLREARLAPEGARIDVFVIMGGVDFKVPESWSVVLNVTPIMGGTEHKGGSAIAAGPGSPTLTIGGVVIMGGVEVKN